MPQISRIRIVNCIYNDRSRLIPDELYDLSSPGTQDAMNSLFNLNNGGGKTVLVQLMMQPVLPRAKAGNRRIEEYFSQSGDHSYILLEWNKDGGAGKLLTGISIAAGSNNSMEDESRGNIIRYYTFMTEYTEQSPYSIEALDLSKNENGRFVPETFSFMREKAKNSKGMVLCYSQDESRLWEKKLAEYGIYKSEWESVIETLNKDEGGLNQYFDEAKTSDKLLARFFIPAIENRMRSIVSRDMDSSLETMIINYAKRIADKEDIIRESETNKELLIRLDKLRQLSENLYEINERLQSCSAEVIGFKASLHGLIKSIKERIINIDEEIQNIEVQINHIKHEEKSREYYIAKEGYNRANELFKKCKSLLSECRDRLTELRRKEALFQCAEAYKEKRNALSKIEAYSVQIKKIEEDSDEAALIGRLKYSVKVKAEEELKEIEERITEESARLASLNEECEKLDGEIRTAENKVIAAKDIFNKTEARLEVSKDNTDKKISSMDIPAIRQLDGFYSMNDVKEERIHKLEQKETVKKLLEEAELRYTETEESIREIPQELAGIKIDRSNILRNLEEIKDLIVIYEARLYTIKTVCARYGINIDNAFSGKLRDLVEAKLQREKAELIEYKNRLQELKTKQETASKGHIHILPEIMDYVVSTGIKCISGEEYLCNQLKKGLITREKMDELLNNYPAVAYSLIFYTKKDMESLLSAGNVSWLPAAVPLIEMDTFSDILSGKTADSRMLAVYDEEYFHDREGYMARLEEQTAGIHDQIERTESHIAETEEDKQKACDFDYTKDWKEKKDNELQTYNEKVDSLNKKEELLNIRSKTLSEELAKINKERETLRKDADRIEYWIASFEELLALIEKERGIYDDYVKCEEELSAKQEEFVLLKQRFIEVQKETGSLGNALNDKKEKQTELKLIMERVTDAGDSEVMQGDLISLFDQYVTLTDSLNEDIDKIRHNLDEAREVVKRCETRIKGLACREDEYSDISYSDEKLNRIRDELRLTEDEMTDLQEKYDEANSSNSGAWTRYEASVKGLEDFDNIPLPMNEVGNDFRKRIKEKTAYIRSLTSERDDIRRKSDKADNCIIRVNEEIEGLLYPDTIPQIILEDDINNQWSGLRMHLKKVKKEYLDAKNGFTEEIRSVVTGYQDAVLAEIVNKLISIAGMLDEVNMKGDRLFTVSDSIDTMISSIEKINSRIETDIREIENDFRDIVDQCMSQGKRLYSDLRYIEKNSRARIYEGKPLIQMVRFDLPGEKEISEEASRVSIENELRLSANELRDLIKDQQTEPRAVMKKAKAAVGSEKLLHKYIRQDSITVRVYKIDINSENSRHKRWEDTLTQSSGAEKFVAFFAVVLTLMNYTRSQEGLMNKDAGSVLLLDNPFGKITSAHLLKPMFEIARRFRVQLICLSDINKSDVIHCFDNVIKIVVKPQALSNKEILTHEGNEDIEHGYYKIMNRQMSLFSLLQ